MARDDIEEHFLLRVQDPEVADKLRKALREERPLSQGLELFFDGPSREGTFRVDGVDYPVTLMDLPTVVESYKTLDDINLVKITDIGQMLLVRPQGSHPPAVTEAVDGVTPAFRDARRRWFRPTVVADPEVVRKVEADILAIMGGHAPEGMQFHDIEEEYVIDPETNEGRWRPLAKT